MWNTVASLLGRLFPDACPRCDQRSIEGFCGDCRQEFPHVRAPCARCAMPSPCGPSCPGLTAGWHLDAVVAPFVYAPPLSRYIQGLKYERRRDLGRPLGTLVLAELPATHRTADAIVPVPLHRRRLRTRTFNQADEIAATLAARLRLPLLGNTARRAVDTEPQTALGRSERRNFSTGTFTARGSLSGLDLIVVDDVITTGATVNALALALKRAGAARVTALAVARSIGSNPAQTPRKI